MQLEKLKKNFIDALPTILLSLFLFFSIKIIWGSENVMLALIMPNYFNSIKGKKVNAKKIIRDGFIITLLGILSDLATFNGFNMIVLNILVPFCIVLFLSDKYNPNRYFIYGLVYTLFQMYSIPVNRLYTRIVVFIYTFIIIFIATYLSALKVKESPIISTVKLGLSQVVSQFEGIYTDENYKTSKNPLVDTANKLSVLLYESAKNKKPISNPKGLYYNRFVIIFKHINQLINHIKKSPDLDDAGKKYFLDLACFIKNLKTIKREEVMQYIEAANNDHLLKDDVLRKESEYIMDSLITLMQSGNEKYKNEWINENTKKERFSKQFFSMASTQMRFGIRLSLIMLISGILVNIINPYIPKAHWLSLNTYVMMLPFYEDSTTRIFQRMKGTVLGLIGFYIAFHILGYTPTSVIAFTIIGVMAMFMAKVYYIRAGILTSFSLFLSSGTISSTELIFLRMALVLLAAILVYFSNKFILPTGNYEELLIKLRELINLDKKILNHIYETACEDKPIDVHTFNTFLLESNMMSRSIETHENSQRKYGSREISQGFLVYNQKLLLEFVKMAKIISNSDFKFEELDYFKKVILQIENSLTEIYEIIEKYYNRYDLDDGISIIDDNLYMNRTLISSIEKIYEINDLIWNKK